MTQPIKYQKHNIAKFFRLATLYLLLLLVVLALVLCLRIFAQTTGKSATEAYHHKRAVVRSSGTESTGKTVIEAYHSEKDANGEETWLRRCQHHLCTPHQQPASYYLCEAKNHEWSLTFLAGGHWPSNQGPRTERASEYAGHKGWSGSIVRGLTALGPDAGSWNYNPSHTDMLNDVLWTDDCGRARIGIRGGEVNGVKFVVCGAVGNTFENADDFADPNIGFLIAPSSWVADRFRGQRVAIRIVVSGVDPDFFEPSILGRNKTSRHYVIKPGKTVVIYLKSSCDGCHGFTLQTPLVQELNATLVTRGWKAIFVEYGSYSQQEWRDALDQAFAAIFMTPTESQSIALAEAWAMDIPTFVYEVSPIHPAPIFGKVWPHANEGPYINYLNGARWSTIDGLVTLLNDMQPQPLPQPWAPREYVLNTMTDKVSVWNALRAIECEWRNRYSN